MRHSQPIAFPPAHRRAILLLLIVLLGYVGLRLLRDEMFIDDPQPVRSLRQHELADRIDPNTADLAALAALPGLGERRAADIIAYRDAAAKDDLSRPVFTRPEDLLKIRGIGYAMMTQLAPYLMFPAPPPATAATTRQAS